MGGIALAVQKFDEADGYVVVALSCGGFFLGGGDECGRGGGDGEHGCFAEFEAVVLDIFGRAGGDGGSLRWKHSRSLRLMEANFEKSGMV